MSRESIAYLLGIDVGTQGSKGILLKTTGEVVARCAVEHEISFPRPGWAEHDADKVWWGDFVKLARELLRRSAIDPERIAAVGVSAVNPVMVPIDARGRPLRPGILYGIDTRSTAEIQWLNHDLGWDRPEVPPSRRLTSQSVSPKVIWLRENEPELWKRTAKVLGATGYIVFRLTGVTAIDSGTVSALAPFYNAAIGTWDEGMCEHFGVPTSIFPKVHAVTDIVGTITPEAAEQTGLAAGTPVSCGTGDATAEYLSAGVVEAGDAGVLYGTTMCMSVLSAEPHTHPLLWGHKSIVPGLFGTGGGMATSAALTRWFRDQFGREEMDVERHLGVNAYHVLSDEASTVPPGAEGLVVLPYFAGERTPIHDGEARGLILGLTIYHTRRHIYRALLEGTAYGLRHHIDLMAEVDVRPKRIVAAGGGSLDPLWTQIVSDVIGMPQECVETPYGPPLGDAFLAGYGAGLLHDFHALKDRWVRIGRRVEPRPAFTAFYERYYAIYRRLYGQTVEEMHGLARLARLSPG